MINSISQPILNRMKHLEQLDTRDRADGTERMKRLRQIPPESGQFIALMALIAPVGDIIEIGTSAGYSTLWLSLAAREKKCRITTFEILEEKVKLARETFRLAKVEDVVNLIDGDALDHLKNLSDVSFCFLDAEKEVYTSCYDLIIPKMKSNGILIADNVISHKEELQQFVDKAIGDVNVDAIVVPIGKGLLLCRKI
ncbi:MAG: O-methyltransferase [Candidatus Zixiibacteriota bacterium]